MSFLVSLNDTGQPNARQLIVLETPEDEAWGAWGGVAQVCFGAWGCANFANFGRDYI